jgi:hypothetical protein
MKINKVDFYCGAFLSYLITNKVEPTLFEAGEKSKILRFSIKETDYKAFLKYSTVPKTSTTGKKASTKWDANFTEKEIELLSVFPERGRENVVVLVCTDADMKDTFFTILTYEEAKICLGTDDVNKQKRISVSHLKSSPYITCYGTALSDIKALQKRYNADMFFEFKEVTTNDKT